MIRTLISFPTSAIIGSSTNSLKKLKPKGFYVSAAFVQLLARLSAKGLKMKISSYFQVIKKTI
jgi:hypothetical protein